MGKLSLVLTRVDGGRGQNAWAHADGDLVDDAGGVGGVLHGVPRRPLGGHQVRDGARGAQGGRGGVGVEVGLGGQVSSSSRGQVRMNRTVAGAIVRERVRGLSYRWSDVGLLSPVTPCAISRDVLLGLDKDSNSDKRLQETALHLHGGVWQPPCDTRMASGKSLTLLLTPLAPPQSSLGHG